MNNLYYMLNITISGIKCIENEVRLDFYKKTIDKNFNPDKYRIKAIYGENGAGKSAIITAIKIFQDIISNSQYLNESNNQKLLDEIINKKTKRFYFNCEYLVDIEQDLIVYNYAVELGKNDSGLYEIKHEILKSRSGNYVNSKYKKIFESKDGKLIHINCEGNNKEVLEKASYNLLSSNSFIRLCIMNMNNLENSNDNFIINILLCFTLTLVINVYTEDADHHQLYFLRKVVDDIKQKNTKYFKNISNIIDGISALSGMNDNVVPKKVFDSYKESVKQLTRFIKLFKKELVSIDIDAKDDGDVYRCGLNLNYGEYAVNREFESTGIKKLIKLFSCFKAASNSGIVFVDEMDSNLNDVYLCKLIEYFMYYGKGQLCFTTHNLDPMSVLKDNKNSIDFLSSDNEIVSWVSKGNASPDNYYRNGMIKNTPFNVDATDFIGIFED